MKKRTNVFLALLVWGGLIGCASKVPNIKYHSSPYQTKVMALQHWDVLAQEVAIKIAANPTLSGKTISPDHAGSSEFAQAFNRMLKAELLNNNLKIVPMPEGETILSVETQLVEHGKRFDENHTTFFNKHLFEANQIITGKEVGTPDPTKSELLIFSVLRQGGVPKLAVKQIVYVSSDEAYLYHAKEGQTFSTSNEP